MNREFLPEAVLGITLGLLVAALVAFRSGSAPRAGVLRRAGVLGLLVYAVVAAPVFVRGGMTLLGLLLLLGVVCLPVVALSVAPRGDSGAGDSGSGDSGSGDSVHRIVTTIAATGLLAVLLIAAGQTLSMLGLVDPRATVAAIALVATLLVAGAGLAGSSRLGSTTVWVLGVPILLCLALGVFLGGLGEVASPLVEVDGPSIAHVVAIAAAVFVLGWSDGTLARLARTDGWSPARVVAGALLVVGLISLGLLMFLGGAMISPSLQFFVLPANLDMLPGLAGIILAILTLLFVALVASVLAGIGHGGGDQTSVPWAVGAAAAATLLALLDPGGESVLVAASLVAAAVVGAQLGAADVRRGLLAGGATAVGAIVVLALLGELELGWAALAGLVAVLAVALVAARTGSAAAPTVGDSAATTAS